MYRFTRLPFWVALAGDVFQQKINEIFKDLLNVFGIADAILLVGYDSDGRDKERILEHVRQIWHQENLKLYTSLTKK